MNTEQCVVTMLVLVFITCVIGALWSDDSEKKFMIECIKTHGVAECRGAR